MTATQTIERGWMGEAEYWPRLLHELRARVKREHYETWFKGLKVCAVTKDELDLGVPNGFTRDWLGRHYHDVLRQAAASVDGLERKIRLTVQPFTSPPESEVLPAPAAAIVGTVRNDPVRENLAYYRRNSDVELNESYTFEHFVVGPCNRIAHATSMAVAENPSQSYNPLFLHGAVGLGKTHLLQAVCHTLLRKKQPINILYLSCEKFINHYIHSLQHGEVESFRFKYRNVDILLIDDIHFLANKERTQDEFFHTFNALYNAHKQIVLSSDSPPKEIPSLQERLVSRFKWGLVAEIEQPAFETRMAILKRKARLRGREFPDDVAQFLAEHISNNIRELEGAVAKVIGYSTIYERPINLELAKEAMRDVLRLRFPRITLQDVLETVSTEYGVSIKDLQSKRRPPSVAIPRQIGMYLARVHTTHSLQEIGAHFGGRDHTTVMYALDRVKQKMAEDPRVREEVSRLGTHLGSPRGS